MTTIITTFPKPSSLNIVTTITNVIMILGLLVILVVIIKIIWPRITQHWEKNEPDETITEDIQPPKRPKKKSKDYTLITTETEIRMRHCEVKDDHTLKFGNKNVKIMPGRPAHQIVLPLRDLNPSFLGKRFTPKLVAVRGYVVQKEGEVTHDPNLTHRDPEMEMRFEETLKLIDSAGKAKFADNIMQGLKSKVTWQEMIPYLVIGVIVIAFLFAFQIAPNL